MWQWHFLYISNEVSHVHLALVGCMNQLPSMREPGMTQTGHNLILSQKYCMHEVEIVYESSC